MNELQINRREFLQSQTGLVIGFSGGLTGLMATDASAQSAVPVVLGPHPSTLDTWLRISTDGMVTVNFGKMDCGQGIDVAIAQFVADELDVSFDKVHVIMGDSRLTPNQGGGSGSTGLRTGSKPIRNAAAEARRVLLAAGSVQLGAPVDALGVENGRIFVRAEPARAVTYAALIGGKTFNTPMTWNKAIGNNMDAVGQAKPKNPAEFKVVGQGIKRRDIADKVGAVEHYTSHIRPEHLLHARAVRPPVAGAMPLAIDNASIAKIPGARSFVKDGFVAVVAETEWNAIRASRALKVQWSEVKSPLVGGHQKVFDYIRTAQPSASNAVSAFFGKKAYNPQPTLDALAGSAKTLEADYECAFQSHARISPSCGVVSVVGDKAEIWADVQKPHFLRDGIAKFLGLPVENVQIKWMHGSGSYGRSDADEAPYEAALLSQAFGRPVRMQWSREEGTAWDPKAPAAIISMKAGLDVNNNVTCWYFKAKGFNGWDVKFNAESPEHTLVGMLTGHKKWTAYNFNVPEESYQFANHVHWWETVPPYLQEASPLRTAHLRAPQEMQTRFGQECFIDEVAHAAGIDPVEFRLKHLREPREIDVVKAAAEKIGWTKRTSRDTSGKVLTGRGLSLHSGYQSHAAVAVEVAVYKDTGRIWVKKVVLANDCGLMVNPIGVRSALEAQIMQGISRSLYEEVHFNEERVTSVDWRTYRIAKMEDMPAQVELVLLNRPDKPIGGVGEPAIVCFPSAIANAVFDATGVRIRRYPLIPERVKQQLA
jgi:CO/xanthine dehydrogenase Mo-binding subunit